MAPAATENVTYGVIGVGLMGIEHIRNLLVLDGAEITCIADNFAQSIETCLDMLQTESPDTASSVKVFTDAKELFESNCCDVAIISTPNHTHHEVLMQAYQYGNPSMHILVEKPMCTTIEDCRAIIAAAKDRVGITYVGLEYSYMPPINRIIADTKSGLIGSPQMVAIREHRFPFLQKVRNWNRFSANSGGTFVEKCCHFFDLFNRILSPAIPVRVYACGGQNINHIDEFYDGKRSDIFDNGFVNVEYCDKKRACLDLCMFAEASHSQEEISIVGDKGKLEAFLPQLEVRTGIRGKDKCGDVKKEIVDDERIKYKGHHYGSSYLEHLDILKAMQEMDGGRSKKISTSGLYQGLMSVAIGVAAHISIEERRVVEISEILTNEEIEKSVVV